jgi:hypothetical protein
MMLLTGCGASASSEQTAQEPDGRLTGLDVSGASDEQASEISDGVATADEYREAFQRYRTCLSAAGFDLVGVRFTQSLYEFGVPDAAVEGGADDECYASEFQFTDMLWQTSDAVQNKSDTAHLLRTCLRERGIEPRGTLNEMDSQLREAGIEAPECLS